MSPCNHRVWRFGRDVDTDQMVPGRFSPYMTSEAELASHAFCEARPEFAREIKSGDVIVAGTNFGCGSSREYAPRALVLAGVAAVFAPQFARIFYRNALNLGLPLFEVDLPDLADGCAIRFDSEAYELHAEAGQVELPEPSSIQREVWDAGGVLPFYKQHGRLPGEQAHA